MTRHTPESLCISAVVNSGSVSHHTQYGVVATYFDGFRAEYEWLESFIKNYGRTPSREEFLTKWPEFPMSIEQDDARWPASELMREYTEKKTSRTLMAAGLALRSGNLDDAIEKMQSVEVIQPVLKPPSLLRDYTYLDSYDQEDERIGIPWMTPQEYTLGIGKGELWYLAARPSQGKSFLALNIAAHAAIQGNNVVIYSLEMTKRQTQQRMHVILANTLGIKLNLNDVRHRRVPAVEYKGILQDLEAQVPGEIHIHTPADGAVTPSVIGANADSYDLSIVDYIGLMRPDSMGRAVDDWRTLAAISNQLKEIALQHNTRIIAASQVNREAGNSRMPPKLSQLSQSDALGQDADVVITFTRPSMHTMQYSMEKNRHGQAGTRFYSHYDVAYGNMGEITRERAEEIRADDEEIEGF